MRNLELPGRSPVHAPSGMAASSSPLATLAAIGILQKGGNAMDGAIAACAVQCVTEPESTGIGGDCFCLYAPGGSEDIVAFNGSGTAPAAATADWYAAQGIARIERQSPHSVVVPGAIDAWYQLNRDHGSMPLAELLAPAIAYAENGYPVASRVASDFAGQRTVIEADANLKRTFMPNGVLPKVGDMHRLPELAATLRKIGENGRDAFYTGDVADDIVSYLQGKGGLHTLDDFRDYVGAYVTPISTDFRGCRVYECPPNGQGIIALLLLNMMKQVDPASVPVNSAARYHLEIEAGKLAYHDRDAWLADPSQADVPVDWLLSERHAKDLMAKIDPDKAMSALPPVDLPDHRDTVYLTVVDKDRNACSFINTLFYNFGSGLMAPKSGVVLTNRAQGFVLDPAHPNCIAPRKRPLHTIIPGMVAKDGRAVMPFGVMGGGYQAFGHMNFLSRFFDYGMDIQEAQDSPRLFPEPGQDAVEVECGVPANVVAELKAKGHTFVAPEKPIGGSQAIWIDWEQGVLTGGSDPRKDGCAIGY